MTMTTSRRAVLAGVAALPALGTPVAAAAAPDYEEIVWNPAAHLRS